MGGLSLAGDDERHNFHYVVGEAHESINLTHARVTNTFGERADSTVSAVELNKIEFSSRTIEYMFVGVYT